MPPLTTFPLDHLPPNHSLHIALYHSVSNAAALHAHLLAGNPDFEYAFIDASVIVSQLHILAAAFRAINDSIEGRLRTRNVHSEVVFCLSPNNNISQSLQRFGISPSTTSLLALKILTPSSPPSLTPTTIDTHLASSVEGVRVPFSDEELAKMTDWERVRGLYKLALPAGVAQGGKKGKGGVQVDGEEGMKADKEEEERERRKELGIQILGSMALRGAS